MRATFIGLALLLGTALPSYADDDFEAGAGGSVTVGAPVVLDTVQVIRAAAVRFGVNPDYLVRVARCESGPGLNRFAIGRAGEQGIFQIHPAGLGPTFRRMGYSDPFDVEQASAFAAWAFANGLASHWSCR